MYLNTEGDFEYLGRTDRQIKTWGYQVSLDEIEASLLADARIQRAAVYPVPDGDGSNIIEGAVILTEGTHAGMTLLGPFHTPATQLNTKPIVDQ